MLSWSRPRAGILSTRRGITTFALTRTRRCKSGRSAALSTRGSLHQRSVSGCGRKHWPRTRDTPVISGAPSARSRSSSLSRVRRPLSAEPGSTIAGLGSSRVAQALESPARPLARKHESEPQLAPRHHAAVGVARSRCRAGAGRRRALTVHALLPLDRRRGAGGVSGPAPASPDPLTGDFSVRGLHWRPPGDVAAFCRSSFAQCRRVTFFSRGTEDRG